MSLLTDASLLLTPNAYKEGKLYSVIPSNGNGDFTATRATTATRVNSAGLVDLVPYNLVQYSEQFDNAFWAKLNVTISPNATTSPDGSITADKLIGDNNNLSKSLYRIIGVSASTIYTGSVFVKAAEYTKFYFRSGSITAAAATFDLTGNGSVIETFGSPISASIIALANGWYKVSLTHTTASTNPAWAPNYVGYPNLGAIIDSQGVIYQGDGTSGVFIWGAQLVEGTSARDYLRTETRLNIPRIDYSLGGCPNILLEPQRTNLALQSSSFDSASWVGSAGITVNSHISPSGVMDADTLTDSSNTIYQTKVQNYTITANASYTTSIFIRKTTGAVTSYPGLTLLFSGGSSRIIRLIFNTTTGTFNFEISGLPAVNSYSARVVDFNADYWRVELTTQENQSNTSLQLLLSPAISLDGITITSSATGSVVAWGAQLEAGAYATSYIPTTTASVTRNADSITRNNIFTNGLITAAGGTWFVELRNNMALQRDNTSLTLSLVDTIGFGNNALYFRNAGAGRLLIGKTVAGVTTVNLYATTTDTCKIAIKWNGSTADIFENGVKVVSATAFTGTALENLNSAPQVATFINEMALFPTPLTDAQCLALTA